MEKVLHTKAEVLHKTVQEEKGILNAVVGSTDVLDRMGDSISQSGWDIAAYKKTNPVILWGHNVKEEKPPIGKALKVWVMGKGKAAKLMFKVQFDLQDSFAAEIFRKVKDGYLNTVSVGFRPIEWEDLDAKNMFGGRKYVKQELLELSFVPVPANPQAVVALKAMKDKRFDPVEVKDMYAKKKVKKVIKKKVIEVVKKVKKTVKKTKKHIKVAPKKVVKKKVISKKVTPYKDLDTLPDSAAWDGNGEVKKADTTDLKLMSTWYDNSKPDVKSSYKLPHHAAIGHKAVWRGVAAAMAALLGARGGVDIPEADRKGVYNHLKKHYKQFDKPVPEFKAVKDQILKGFDEEIHALMLDREDRYTVRLIKKGIREQKKSRKVHKIAVGKSYTEKNLEAALRVVDLALSQVLKDSEEGG